MKKFIVILSLIGFSAFAQTNSKTCPKDCCSTETCKTHCIEMKCCEQGKTCDLTTHQACKHKCCEIATKNCSIEGKNTCCKTK